MVAQSGSEVNRLLDRRPVQPLPAADRGQRGAGSGESGVLRALCRLDPHWNGRMTVDGKALAPKRDEAFIRLVQMVL